MRSLKEYQKNLVPLVDAMKHMKHLKLIHALYKSSESKKWIKVSNKNLSRYLGKNN